MKNVTMANIPNKRVTVLFCCNMSGTERLTRIAIGKSTTPACLSGVNKMNLEVYYRNNKKAWMTKIIWKEWLSKTDKKFKHENRKI